MSDSSGEFARYARAERQFSDAAGPVLDEVVRSIEARSGLRITEVRVTVDWANQSGGSIMANCTIVRAHPSQQSDGHDIQSVRKTAPINGGWSSKRD